ncbi:MAG: CehA/McbA family metallohydrolase [Isosphaeraceae bacterium]
MTAASVKRTLWLGLLASLACAPARAADLVALSPSTWDRYAPAGKEADAIYGDFVLANNQVVAVVAHPKRGRHANMTVRDVGGCVIDLTTRNRQSDQLSAYYPGAMSRDLRFAGIDVDAPEVYETEALDRVFVRARRVTLRLVATPKEKEPDVEVSYTLEDGQPYLTVTTRFTNRGKALATSDLVDSIRADRSFEHNATAGPLFWVFDKHFGQAYGVLADGGDAVGTAARQYLVRFREGGSKVAARLEPRQSHTLTRRLIPGANLFDVRRVADQIAGKKPAAVALTVKDAKGSPVPDADVVLTREGKPFSWGRTDASGRIRVAPGELTVTALGRGSKTASVAEGSTTAEVELPEAGTVEAAITDEAGKPIACKVAFTGRDGTETPNFGPDGGEHAVRNLYYSHDGKFKQVLAPGSYDVIVSHGPEYDAVFTRLDVERGKAAKLSAKLVRSVKTSGWISTDFHSHSSPSGDNTSSQLGRVLNLLCEHIEFAPCTEHNRLSTYDPHLKRLKAQDRMATCVGMELTGKPLPLNHQNAFPLVLRPHTQDGGGPANDDDPAVQIERLALWDGGTEKLVQVNHPDMGWMFRDRDGNGTPDNGFTGMFGHIDVIEIHPPHWIFGEPKVKVGANLENNTIVNWLQLLNQGRRIPGVVNTDAHYNFHGSGWLRNYVKSPTDDPSEIQTLDVVRACERGRVVMTTGPFLEVSMRPASGGGGEAGPGDDLALAGGKAVLKVRVQCPNWFDVDRVQVFVNGRAEPALNFTRKNASERFSAATVKFDQEIPVTLDRDAHVIVAAIGEGSKLGPVMGPEHAADLPVAVSNPIFVDVDGGGFKPNGDTLGSLPVKSSR